uniref:Uncharacterized protein n=1 Tax=Caenorhabditis japonica TaxID=281687 RepID=A0A8R1EXZ5_CAEJA
MIKMLKVFLIYLLFIQMLFALPVRKLSTSDEEVSQRSKRAFDRFDYNGVFSFGLPRFSINEPSSFEKWDSESAPKRRKL